jgi:hypothetical protein
MDPNRLRGVPSYTRLARPRRDPRAGRAARARGRASGAHTSSGSLPQRSTPRGVTLAMPSAGMVRAAEMGPPRGAAWLRVLAGIVHDDRDETVGGRRHARPTVAVR